MAIITTRPQEPAIDTRYQKPLLSNFIGGGGVSIRKDWRNNFIFSASLGIIDFTFFAVIFSLSQQIIFFFKLLLQFHLFFWMDSVGKTDATTTNMTNPCYLSCFLFCSSQHHYVYVSSSQHHYVYVWKKFLCSLASLCCFFQVKVVVASTRLSWYLIHNGPGWWILKG